MGDTICQHNLQSEKLASFKTNESTVKPASRPPRYYGHLVISATLFWPPGKTAIHFLVKILSLRRSPVNMAKLFFGSICDRINGVPLYTLTFGILNSRAWQVSSLQRLPLTRAFEGFFLSVETRVFVDVNQLFPWFSHALWQRRFPHR